MDEFYIDNKLRNSVSKLNKIRKILLYLVFLGLFFLVFYYFFLSAPSNFSLGTIIRIEKGSSLHSISSILKKQNIIRSRVVFESFVIMLGGERRTISADYLFENKLPVWEVARRILGGKYYAASVVITIPEGFDVNQIAEVSSQKLTNFNKDQFLKQAEGIEGYLFPDTYYFLTDDNEDVVLQSMRDNFKKKFSPFISRIVSLGKTEKEIITMASIIEREASGDNDRGVISGILWKRIKIGMPLQVDAAPDTYRTKGLPHSPISNPGLSSIKVAIEPKNSPYLYYLHDKNGNIYYAKSFTEHKRNIDKYLR